MGASWGHLVIMNLDKYNALPADLKKIMDDMKKDYLAEFLRSYDKATADTLESWKKSGKVEIIKINADDFNKATLGNAKVQSVRNSWIDRAMKAGMPEASAKKVVNDINN
jgi:TRAP-type C4-dicarboxylate transport system substrate-binding protein